MHPYLTKLGVPADVQAYFRPYYNTDAGGNLVFVYGNNAEVYGLGFHYVPVSGDLWIAGNNLSMIRQVFICASAMDAIAFLSLNFNYFKNPDHLLFVATGLHSCKAHIDWIARKLPHRTIRLLFCSDLSGRIAGAKVAAGIRGLQLTVTVAKDTVNVRFRFRDYQFTTDNFSLNQFEKQSGQRFRCRTAKARGADSWANQLFQLLAKKK